LVLGRLTFGIFLPFHLLQAKGIQPRERFCKIRDIVLECEKLGYHSVWLDDHLMYNDWPILECWTTLSALAPLTTSIRLGTMVSCTSHRNPALIAKMGATIDVISGGRLELGIGAGIQEKEHLAYGFGFPKLNVRVEQLAEALQVIKLLWTEDKATFHGKHYSLKEAVCEPKPIQKPYPPITVGGSSIALISEVTAPYANSFDWGFLPSSNAYMQKLGALEKQCKASGRNFLEIEKSCWPSGQVLIAKSQKELKEKISKFKPAKVGLAEFRKTSLIGTPEQCIEQLQVYGDMGVTNFMLYFADFPEMAGLRLFAETVADKTNS
jgi:alkanesulfonate monooxygenase SsuD/methylene tetrahydromethanopterin reductase-like flavin-dependent oxidoreductase (luciferase family)